MQLSEEDPEETTDIWLTSKLVAKLVGMTALLLTGVLSIKNIVRLIRTVSDFTTVQRSYQSLDISVITGIIVARLDAPSLVLALVWAFCRQIYPAPRGKSHLGRYHGNQFGSKHKHRQYSYKPCLQEYIRSWNAPSRLLVLQRCTRGSHDHQHLVQGPAGTHNPTQLGPFGVNLIMDTFAARVLISLALASYRLASNNNIPSLRRETCARPLPHLARVRGQLRRLATQMELGCSRPARPRHLARHLLRPSK